MRKMFIIILGVFLIVSGKLSSQQYYWPSDTNLNAIRDTFYLHFQENSDTNEGSALRLFQRWDEHWGPDLAPTGSFKIAQEALNEFWDDRVQYFNTLPIQLCKKE